MSAINHERLTAMRQHPRYGAILDRALNAWFKPLLSDRVNPARHGFGSYPGGNQKIGSAPDMTYSPCEKKSCCLLGAARIGLPGSFNGFAAMLKISTTEVTAITAGFDAENEPELERALYGFQDNEEAVRFGHGVAVSLGLPFDQLDSQNRPVVSAFVALVSSHKLIDGVPALLTIMRTSKEIGISIPGGKVDPGETTADAAVREIWEEIGAVIPKRDLIVLGTWDWHDVPITTYIVDLAEPNTVQLDVEIENRVYTPTWRPYVVMCDRSESAFPVWGDTFCHLLQVYFESGEQSADLI